MPDDNSQIPEIVRRATKRYEVMAEAERKPREEALDDIKFRAGEQWNERIKKDREAKGKPCLTINRLPQFEHQVTNEMRQNRPSIKVSPTSSGATEETADVLSGLLRHIEYDSDADIAYDTAGTAQVRGGWGYIEVATEYESQDSFDQVIKIKRVRNQFQIYFDPDCQAYDYADAKDACRVTTLTKDEYKRAFPDTEMASLDSWKSVGDADPDWLSEDSCRIAEYWYRDEVDDELIQLRNKAGQTTTVLKSQLKTLPPEFRKGTTVINERKTKRVTIKWVKLNAIEVLDETEIPGDRIPLFPVLGDEVDVDGERHLEGIVRHAKDSQRMYNYWASKETQAIALSSGAPYIGAKGQFKGVEARWQGANIDDPAYLEYDPVNIQGQPAPPPARQVAEPAVAAITGARMASAEDLKATTGIYDASLGARSNEVTGKAIQARQQQGSLANFHLVDNLTRTLRSVGRYILSIAGKIYDSPRVVRIIGEDGKHEIVQINQFFTKNGEQKKYDLTVGKYDIVVSTGASYQTRRKEAEDSLVDISKAYPQLWAVAGDLIAGMMDWPGHEALQERLRKTLPAQLQDQDAQGNMANLVQTAAQGKQEAQAMHAYAQQLEQKLQAAEQEKQAKIVDNEYRMKLEEMKEIHADFRAEVATKAQNERERMKWEHSAWLESHSAAHEVASAAVAPPPTPNADGEQPQQGPQ